MAEEKELSPEEKLLRVIQGKKGGEQAATSPAPARPSAAPAAPAGPSSSPPVRPAARPAVAPAAVVPALIDDKVEEAATANLPPVAPAPAAGVEAKGDDPRPQVRKLRRNDEQGVQRANRMLMLAAALILILVGFQIWANVSERPLPAAKPGDALLPAEPTNLVLAATSEYVKLFEDRPWFPPAGGGGVVVTSVIQTVDALTLVRQSVRLVAVSDLGEGQMEAIVVDNTTGRMHFLRPGGRLLAGEKGKEKELTLVRAERDHAVLSDGKEEFVLK